MEEKKIPDFDNAGAADNADLFTLWRPSLGKMLKLTWSAIRSAIVTIVNEAVAAINLALIAEWDNTKPYVLDELSTFGNRIWKSKDNGNLNNEPPSDPEVTENTWWIEQSKGEAFRAPDYAPGVFTQRHSVVVSGGLLHRLIVPEIELPYTSTDLAAELLAGDWEVIGGSGSGDSVPDGDFVTYSAASIILNPTKKINNNYVWNLPSFGPYQMSFDFTDVPDGASGIIEIVKDSGSNRRYIPLPTASTVNEDDYSEEPDQATANVNISNITNSGGLARIDTAAAHGLADNNRVLVSAAGGTVEANGKWTADAIDADTLDLVGSTFVNAYTTGGTVRKLANYLAIEQIAEGLTIISFYNRNGRIRMNLRRGYMDV